MSWGARKLQSAHPANRPRCSASITYQKLYAPPTPRDAIFEHVDMNRDYALWRFYRHPGDDRELPTRPSYSILTACYQAGLFRIIDKSLNLYCGIQGQVSAEKVLEVYRRYMDWKSDLPSEIANVDVADQPLPHILYLQ